MRTVLTVLRSIAAVVLGYVVIALGTILTFNVIVGQITVDSPPSQMFAGTVGAVIAGLCGGMVAAWIAPFRPVLHAFGIWILLAIDTASVIARGPGPIWFDLSGSAVLAICAIVGAILITRRKSSVVAAVS